MASKNIISRIKKKKAQALFDANRLDEAKALFQQVCSLDPVDPEAWVMLGLINARSSQMNEAASCFIKAVTLRPDFAEAHFSLGKTYKALGRLDEAAASFNESLRVRPEWPEAWYHLGNILILQGRANDALACYRRVLAIKPGFSKVVVPFVNLLISSGKLDEAAEYAQRFAQANPGNVELKLVQANIWLMQGRLDRSCAIAKQLIETGDKNIEVDFLYACLCNHEDAISLLEPWLTKNDQQIDDEQRTRLHFILGDLYDKQDNYHQAFEHYHTANRLKSRAFNIEHFSTFIDSMISLFTPDAMSTRPCISSKSARPIFILGMPRSGTTLVEQILASHPDVFGAGELEDIRLLAKELLKMDKDGMILPDCLDGLTAERCHQLADRYLARLDELSATAEYVTDKMPQNFLWVGIIALIFPNAKIIHCMRNPLDISFSCYTNNFAFATNYAYTYDLETLGKYYNEYRRLMHHWQTVLCIPMLDISYETLVADQENMTRALLGYCNLGWDDRCLRFYANARNVATLSYNQVRKPIYSSSVGKWQKYQPYLTPLLESLDVNPDYAEYTPPRTTEFLAPVTPGRLPGDPDRV